MGRQGLRMCQEVADIENLVEMVAVSRREKMSGGRWCLRSDV